MWIWYLAFLAIVNVGGKKILRIPLQAVSKQKLRSADEKVEYLLNYQDAHYINIEAGNPPQVFKVLFDTATSDLWLRSKYCDQATCMNKPSYNSSRSYTYKRQGDNYYSYYLAEVLQGFLSIDTIRIGNTAIEDQIFAEAIKLPKIFNNLDADGILGIGRTQRNVFGDLTVIFNMIRNGVISDPTFSLFLSKRSNSSENKESLVIFGGSDPTYYIPPIKYTPLAISSYWVVNLGLLLIGNETFCRPGCEAIIHSGNPNIGVPIKLVRSVMNAIGPHRKTQNGYEIDCARVPQLPSIKFIINSHTFEIKGKDYLRVGEDGTCNLGLADFRTGAVLPMWGLGAVFLKQYYTEFDFRYKRVGFAKAK